MNKNEMIKLISNTIRGLSMDAVDKAQSGHIGLPLGCAEMVSNLFTYIIKHNPKKSNWINRDRFILSAGHGSILLYSILHLTGYNITIDDIKKFRQLKSKTPGHPEYGMTAGVETTSGPLGQGVSNSVGMAIAEKALASRFNTDKHKIIDHYVYCLVGDGCLMEGISYEACSLAGHLGLDKLILIYDNNKITIDGSTDISFSDDVRKRFEAQNWHVQEIDAYNIDEFGKAIQKAKQENNKPSIIIANTVIGKNLIKYEGTNKAHGNPMNSEDVKLSKEKFGFTSLFQVPDEVLKFYEEKQDEYQNKYEEWKSLFNEWKDGNPSLYEDFVTALKGKVDLSKENILDKTERKNVATRNLSGSVLNAIANKNKFLIGGSADLAGSNKVTIEGSEFISKNNFSGQNMHFGVREHAMGGILNGIALHKCIRPFGSTFLVFSDYMKPSIRLASMMKLPVIYVFTHDTFQVGEDGPTHHPIEHIQALRDIPNLCVLRPADSNEVEEAWKYIMKINTKPCALILTRQKVLDVDRKKYTDAKGLHNGAYIIKDCSKTPELIIMASGSEVELSIEVAEKIEEKNKLSVRVVSMPSHEIFDEQPDSYKNKILPPNVKQRVSIEKGITTGWVKYTGLDGLNIGMDRFGESAPAEHLVDYFGFTPDKIVNKISIFYKL